jgi:hypothetical protein
MKSMTTPGQQLDAAAKRSGRVRAAKASVSEPLLARESRQAAASGQMKSRPATNQFAAATGAPATSLAANGRAANDAGQLPVALLTNLHDTTSAAIDAAGRHGLIAQAAYLRAERRGFNGGCAVTDWLEAEREVDGQLSGRSAEGARCGD